jgi:hypothetical protein
MDAVGAMDGQTFSGTFAESIQPTRACLLLSGTVEGERVADTCGDGDVDAGEECDAGLTGGACCTEFCAARPAGTGCPTDGAACTANATCDGAGACVQNPKPAGTLCRFATDACDTAEFCTGASSACPPETSPTEPDEDGDGILDGCDDCVGVGPLEAVRLRFGRVGVGPARDFLSLRARVRFPSGQTLPDPRGTWKLVEGRDANGGPLFYAQVPGGAYDPSIGSGWTQKGSKWTFRSTEPVIGAVSKMVIFPAEGDPDAWQVRVSTPRGNLNDAVPVPPLSLKLILDGLGPSNRCGQLVFNPPGGVSPSCSAPSGSGAITCK